MKCTLFRSIAATALLGVFLGACGGGGDGVIANEGGIGGSGISRGTITDFGSVWVNGVEFETGAATFSVNGDETVTQDALRLGMVVTVMGTINADGVSGTALRVDYARHLEGPIDSIVSASELVVAGQTVLVDSATELAGVANVTGLSAGNMVQVSGFRDANEQWRATYIGLTAAAFVDGETEVEVKGTLSGLTGNTFMIGTLSIDASALDILALSNGSYVKVEGVSFGGGGELIASEIDAEGAELGVEDADEAELQGLITAVNSADEFVLGTQIVRIGAGAEFESGTATDIRVGLRVEVEGSVAGGVLTADKIDFEEDIELEADVSAVDMGAGTLILAGLDLEVSVNDALTEIDGASGLADIQVGDHVQLRARSTASGGVEATTLDVDSASDIVVLRGVIDTLSGSMVTVLGVDIDLSLVAEGGDEVLAQAVAGDAVELEGTLVDGVVLWESVELDD